MLVRYFQIFILLTGIAFQSACTSHKFDTHFSPSLIPSENLNGSSQNLTPLLPLFYPRSIAVLLPLSNESLSQTATAIQIGFLAAYYQDKEIAPTTLPVIRFYDLSQPEEILQIYKKALAEGAEAVVGPITKESSDMLLSGELHASIPTLLLNYASSSKHFPYVFQLGLSPEDELSQLASLAWRSGHHRAVIFSSEDTWGYRLQAAFKHDWQSLGGSVTETLFLAEKNPSLSETIRTFLYPTTEAARFTKESDAHKTELTPPPLHRQDIDFIVLLLLPEKARQVLPLLNYYYAQDIPVYATSHIYSEETPAQNKDLDGVTFCDMPWLLNPPLALKTSIQGVWPEELARHARFFALGFDSYAVIRHSKTFEHNRNFQYEGLTGTLFLDEENRFHRLLNWAKFRNGVPITVQ